MNHTHYWNPDHKCGKCGLSEFDALLDTRYRVRVVVAKVPYHIRKRVDADWRDRVRFAIALIPPKRK